MTAINILYVEDNDDNAYMLSRRLTKRGYKVVISSDGKAGVEAAQSLLPDLILMDLNLPVMDGIAATRLLKSDDRTADIPVIVVSSHVFPGERDSAIEAGCDEFETKPVQFKRLLGKIEQLTGSNIERRAEVQGSD